MFSMALPIIVICVVFEGIDFIVISDLERKAKMFGLLKYSKENLWTGIVRLLAVFTSIFFWILSVKFSQEGFGITLPKMAWAGYVLAFGVTTMELILNRGKKLNPTLFAAGIASYLYGCGTNIYGVLNARTGLIQISGWDWIFAFAVGLMIEIVPEPLFMYGIGVELGDLLSTLFSGGQQRTDGQRNRNMNNMSKESRFGGFRQLNRTILDASKPDVDGLDDSRMDNEVDGHTNYNPKQRKFARDKVRAFIFRNYRSGMNLSAREVARQVGLGKSIVAEVLREMRDHGEIK
jgi:hypothetical protein